MQSSLELRAKAELELRRRRALAPRAPLTFREFVSKVNPRFIWYRHCEAIASVLERVLAGELRRVLIMAPPRAGKSELVSRLFTAYHVYRYPEKFVALASYGAELAYDLSRAARRNYYGVVDAGAAETTAVKHWETGKGGGAWATGVGGAATGKGYALGGIDDPIKDDRDAQSDLIRERAKDWYRSVWYTRAEPNAAIVLTMTRWHEDDLAGFILAEESGEKPECWHVVNLQSIYEPEGMLDFPKSCTVEPDWRKPGEPLVPERYPLEALRRIEQRIGPRAWSSLHQQYPRPRDGSMFKWEHFENRFLDAVPAGMTWLAYWDTAGTEGAGDHTAGALVGYDARHGRFHIADVVRGQWGPMHKDLEIRAACQRWRALVGVSNVWLETEAGIGGKDRTRATVAALVGFRVQTEHPTGSKVVRAQVWAAQQEAGNVTMSRGDWNHGFISRCTAFPYSNVDDEQDAVAGAFAKIGTMNRGMVGLHPDDVEALRRQLAQGEAVA